MLTTVLDDVKSKEACPSCEQHRLTTNDVHTVDDRMHYHCLSCNYEFSNTAADREQLKKMQKSKDEPSLQAGALFLLLLAAVTLAVFLSERDTQSLQPEARRPSALAVYGVPSAGA